MMKTASRRQKLNTMLRIISLNLNGIRSAWNKNVLPWTISQQADVIALQELKAQLPDLSAEMLAPDGMHAAYHAAEKKGYSGVGLWSRQVPDQVIEGFDGGEFDAEGRYIRADFGNVSIISLYLPSGSSSPERQDAKFRFLDIFFPKMLALRAEGREIILCGDWNIAHQQIDLKNWKSTRKIPAFYLKSAPGSARFSKNSAGLTSIASCTRKPRTGAIHGGAIAGRLGPKMLAGGLIIRSPHRVLRQRHAPLPFIKRLVSPTMRH